MGKEVEEDEEEDQRAGTPTDMRDVDFWTAWAIPSVINLQETVVLAISETDERDYDCENVPHFFLILWDYFIDLFLIYF